MEVFRRLMDKLMAAVTWFLIGVLGVMTIVLFLSVLSRYFFNFSIHWADPVARYGQTWLMLVGSALVLRKGMHIGIDNFVNMLPMKLRQVVLHINILLIFSFSLAMAYQGVVLVDIASSQIIPEIGIPMAWVYYMIPIAGMLLMLTCVELFLKVNIDSLVAKEE